MARGADFIGARLVAVLAMCGRCVRIRPRQVPKVQPRPPKSYVSLKGDKTLNDVSGGIVRVTVKADEPQTATNPRTGAPAGHPQPASQHVPPQAPSVHRPTNPTDGRPPTLQTPPSPDHPSPVQRLVSSCGGEAYVRSGSSRARPAEKPCVPEQRPGAMLAPATPSLDSLVAFLEELVQKNGGRFGSAAYTIDGSAPIRKGLYCVSFQCKLSFGKPVDALFFAVEADFRKQQEICSKRSMLTFQTDIRDVFPPKEYTDAVSKHRVRVPSCIVTEATTSMDEILAPMEAAQRQFTVTAIASALTKQLAALHKDKMVHRGITRCNIVRLGNNSSTIWTFREYCSCRDAGEMLDHTQTFDMLMQPPEVGEATMLSAAKPVRGAMDVWQLGVLLYELYSGNTYWPPDILPAAVLRQLATQGGLPHEADPSLLNSVVRIPSLTGHRPYIIKMLDRLPTNRPTASALSQKLDAIPVDTTLAGNTVTATAPVVFNIP